MNTNDNIHLNEQLFWKVIHNKYLFNLIFEKIHEISNEIEQTHNIKSYKFKDIELVSWMLEYGAFNILKYKLSNNEPIQLSGYCIQGMLNLIINIENFLLNLGFKGTIHDRFFECEIGKLNSILNCDVAHESNKCSKKIVFETIEMLLKNYRHLIIKYDLIKEILNILKNDSKLQQASLELIRTLVGEPYSIVLTPHHFKLVIINFELDFIIEFIEIANQFNCAIVDQDFKNNSISIILNKNEFPIDQQVLKFILDNPQYHSQSYDPSFTPEEQLLPKFVPTIYFSILKEPNEYDGKRDISSFFGLDQNLQIKLLSLKYFNTYEWKYYQEHLGNYMIFNFYDLPKLRKQRDEANQFIYDINYNSDHLDPISKINAINHFFKDYLIK